MVGEPAGVGFFVGFNVGTRVAPVISSVDHGLPTIDPELPTIDPELPTAGAIENPGGVGFLVGVNVGS